MKKFNKIFLTSMVLVASVPNVYAITKDETVYSTLKSNGDLFKTTVVNHLYHTNENEIKDVSELKDILNVNGDEKFTINGNDLTWKNNGKEIFYQGKSEKELPIETKVKYYLDEKELNADDLVGKKGKVRIEIQFVNHDKHETNINGQNEVIYTPFVVTVGSIINNKNASNIEVTNGKIVNTGSKNFVVALASPGLYDSLGLEEFKNMDHVVISFDTNGYKSNSFYVVATPKLIDSVDFRVFDKMDRIYHDVGKLQSNMDVIENGAKELESGAQKLSTGSKEISNNLSMIANYMKELENGTYQLDEGLKQVIEALKGASVQLTTGDTNGSIANLNTLKNGNLEAIETLASTNKTIQDTFLGYGMDIDSVTVKQLQEINPSLASYKQSYDGNNKLMYLLGQNNIAIDGMIEKSTSTVQNIRQLITVLETNLNKIEAGSYSLYNNTSKIRSGMEQLYQGSVTLNNGIDELYSGTSTLKNGISTYNQEGIKSLSSYTSTFKEYADKLNALVDLSEQYKGFASNNSNTTTFVSVIK